MSAPNTRRGPQGGPPPLAPALAYGALLIASVAVWIGAPQAGASAASTLSYAQAHTGQMHAEAVLVFGAACRWPSGRPPSTGGCARWA